METIYDSLLSLTYVVMGFVVLVIAKIAKDMLTPYRIDDQLTKKDNPALGLAVSGYFAGVIIIYLGAVIGPEVEGEIPPSAVVTTLGIDFLYALGGILALNLGRVVVDKLVLYRFSTRKEIIEDRNVGTGAVECGAFVATALIVAGAIHGEGADRLSGILSALVFFVLGQVVLILFTVFYQWITRYDIHKEIERDNVAAGVALGASMVAIGIILLGATAGDFVTWANNLLRFAYTAALGFILLLVLRKVTDLILLRGTTIAHEISTDRNINAAWIEGVVAMGMAAVIFFMI